jgi:hypothetical protein
MAKINLLIDDHTWESFRIACIKHKISASKAVEQLMREKLTQWKSVKETSDEDR